MSPLTVPITILPIGSTPVSASSGRRISMPPFIELAASNTSGTNRMPSRKSMPTMRMPSTSASFSTRSADQPRFRKMRVASSTSVFNPLYRSSWTCSISSSSLREPKSNSASAGSVIDVSMWVFSSRHRTLHGLRTLHGKSQLWSTVVVLRRRRAGMRQSGHRRRAALGGAARDIGVQGFDHGLIAGRGDITRQDIPPDAARALGGRLGAVVGPAAEIAPIGHQRRIEGAAVPFHGMGAPEEMASGPDLGDGVQRKVRETRADGLKYLGEHLQHFDVQDEFFVRGGKPAFEPPRRVQHEIAAP